ncbi:MAG TPA: hypothetical protein VGR45_05200 [Stellaceae bacterium]|nr:hypothetical protein [Stellaceae bacterium]
MIATVEIRLTGGNLAREMGQMRLWLDHRKIATHAFRQSRSPSGLALHVEFNSQTAAEDFATEFARRVLGTPHVASHRRLS